MDERDKLLRKARKTKTKRTVIYIKNQRIYLPKTENCKEKLPSESIK